LYVVAGPLDEAMRTAVAMLAAHQRGDTKDARTLWDGSDDKDEIVLCLLSIGSEFAKMYARLSDRDIDLVFREMLDYAAQRPGGEESS
jgi:hypothetical protein